MINTECCVQPCFSVKLKCWFPIKAKPRIYPHYFPFRRCWIQSEIRSWALKLFQSQAEYSPHRKTACVTLLTLLLRQQCKSWCLWRELLSLIQPRKFKWHANAARHLHMRKSTMTRSLRQVLQRYTFIQLIEIWQWVLTDSCLSLSQVPLEVSSC